MTATTMLGPDAEAILLLSGRFTSGEEAVKPLTTSEYYRLSHWLEGSRLRPGDLLDAYDSIDPADELELDWSRIGRLLERGPALALAADRWFTQGFWILTRADADYPPRYIDRLGSTAPPILYGIGASHLLDMSNRSLAVVGSRDVDERGITFTRDIARKAAIDAIQVVSGGARGVDMTAMTAALEAGGSAVGVFAGNLNRAAVQSEFRDAIRDERLTLISPYHPEAGFKVGTAMARNKLIYTLADWALVISSGDGQGGTWAGATENLKRGWSPLFIRAGEGVPDGNMQLIAQSGIPINSSDVSSDVALASVLDELVARASAQSVTAPVPHRFEDPATEPGEAIFQAIWPVIEGELATPRMLRELLERLGPTIKQGQLKNWLDEAEARGMVERRNRANPYELPDQHDSDRPLQLDMFDFES